MSLPVMNQPLTIADRIFSSRLMAGTGKFASNALMRDTLVSCGSEIVTVALRRADLRGGDDPQADILKFIDPEKYLLLPNTSGAMDADEAVRLARLAAAAGLPKWVKLEIHPDPTYLLPDPIETLKAAEILVKEGFTVLPYINADPVLAREATGGRHGGGDAVGCTHWFKQGGWLLAIRSGSSLIRRSCRWWWMLALERPATQRRRWS